MKPLSSCLTSLLFLWSGVENGEAFLPHIHATQSKTARWTRPMIGEGETTSPNRRLALKQLTTGAVVSLIVPFEAQAEESIFAPKFIQEYPDFTQSTEGWSYKDVKGGIGDSPRTGDRVVFEWSGYTVGYFARPFEARGYVVAYTSQMLHTAS